MNAGDKESGGSLNWKLAYVHSCMNKCSCVGSLKCAF